MKATSNLSYKHLFTARPVLLVIGSLAAVAIFSHTTAIANACVVQESFGGHVSASVLMHIN
jgi:hypothetical protein